MVGKLYIRIFCHELVYGVWEMSTEIYTVVRGVWEKLRGKIYAQCCVKVVAQTPCYVLWNAVVCVVWPNRQGLAVGVEDKYTNILEGTCQMQTNIQHLALAKIEF